MGRDTLNGINVFYENSNVYFHKRSEEVWLGPSNHKWSAPDDVDDLTASLLNDVKVAPLELIEWES